MEFSRFSLGLRFAMTKDADLNEEKAWEILFSMVSPRLLEGMLLYGIWDDTAPYEPEPAYICLFTNTTLKKAKALFAALSTSSLLCSYLTAYRPFVQNNRVEKCKEATYVGKVEADGLVSVGHVSYGQMRFTGSVGSVVNQPGPKKRIVIAPESTGGISSFDLCRRMARAAAMEFPRAQIVTERIASGGTGTLDTLISANDGRYEGCEIDLGEGNASSVRFGILPDETAVLEVAACGEIPLQTVIAAIEKRGFHKLVLAACGSNASFHEVPGMEVTVLSDKPPLDGFRSDTVRYCSGIETVLSACGFFRMIRGASLVVTGTNLIDERAVRLGTTVDSILFHSRKNGIPTAVLAYQSPDAYFGKLGDRSASHLQAKNMNDACEELMSLCKTNGHFKE